MNVKELIERLAKMPANAPVYLRQQAADFGIEVIAEVVDLQIIVSSEYGEAVLIDWEEVDL